VYYSYENVRNPRRVMKEKKRGRKRKRMVRKSKQKRELIIDGNVEGIKWKSERE
jgi:hypothetical protein